MSKRLSANITCPECTQQFPTELYRSIWVETPANRALVLNDQINAVTCPKCKFHQRLEFPFLCTNVRRGFALWYEPHHDPQVDKDVADYCRHFGPDSFYAKAPRIAEWEEFKKKLLELEAEPRQQAQPVSLSSEMQDKMAGFTASIEKKDKRTQGGVFRQFIRSLTGRG